jgi:hypothetical protein
LLQLYWGIREAILNLNGTSRGDFEFGELISKIETIFSEIKMPTMMISHGRLSEAQIHLMRMRALIKPWTGFEAVIGCLDSISSIIEKLLSSNMLNIKVENGTKQNLMELYNNMRVEIEKAYAHK